MPHWNDLSKWMKVQLAVMLLHNWDLLTFNVNLHPELEKRMVTKGQDVRKVILAAIRRELKQATGLATREFYFVVEGWSKGTRQATGLHVHGAVVMWQDLQENDALLIKAIARACGHGIGDRKNRPRAVHRKAFQRERAAYVDYLFKATRKGDSRLDDRNRLAMSRTAVDSTRYFWHMITGQEPEPA